MFTEAKLWKTVEVDSQIVSSIAKEMNIPVPAAAVLVSRGHVSANSISHFLGPRLSELSDPFLLPDMEKAVQRIWAAIRHQETIVIYGDYDVDGITSTALLVHVLGQLGAKVIPFLPHRLEEGYGLSVDAFHRCVSEHKPQLIITVDCGTNSVEAVEEATELGIDVIITDHHTPDKTIASAFAVINPKLGANETLHILAGVGVAFKLAHALLKNGRNANQPKAKELDLRVFLDFVALGTISDIVPLVGENRILASHGLAQLNQTEHRGLRALIDVAGIKNRIDVYEVGFQLGPRLNAAGRLGDALQSLELLTTTSDEVAARIAKHLDTSNRERQAIEAAIVEEAIEEIETIFDPKQHFGLVVARDGWHPGVVGIVASRIVSRFLRPTIVIAFENKNGRGSCRSIEGFDLVAALTGCGQHLLKYGGHAMAAGLEIDVAHLENFKKTFNQVASESLKGKDLRAVQRIDAWLDLGEANDRLLDAMDKMRPFGHTNPTPVWAVRNVRVVAPPRILKERHLKFMIASGGAQCEAIAFNMAERTLPDGPIDIVFQLKKDSYMGREKLVMNVLDFRVAK